MPLFFTDLDQTMIYSYKHDIGIAKRCVERYQEREISFMTDTTFSLFMQLKELALIVPTTTRTMEQYSRIDLGVGSFAYALICNGGVLLKDGREDHGWYKQSLDLIADCGEVLEQGERLMEQDPDRSFEVRNIRSLFLFTKSQQPIVSVEYLRKHIDTGRADVFCNGVKVYIVPRQLNKGNALLRLKKKLNAELTIAAGDSEFDIPMLNAADRAAAPLDLESVGGLLGHVAYMPGQKVFSEELLEYALKCCRGVW